MNNVAIITGGAGGMGLATAKILGRDHHVVIADVNQQRLEDARSDLLQVGVQCDVVICDITDPASVGNLFSTAAKLGSVRCVVHTAGISPQMANPETILRINGVGTVNIARAALEVAHDGFVLVNVASMAAYLVPSFLIPKRAFARASSDPDTFVRKALFPCYFMPGRLYKNGLAYAVSKQFVIWYSKKLASWFGDKGARVVSVSPGTFDTQMGRLEEKSGSVEMLKKAALKRLGRPEEIAELLAFCASEKASYLTGVDILCDGGVVAGSR